MKLLASGVTGQLGTGLLEAARDREARLIALMRPAGTREPRERRERLGELGGTIERALRGDVTEPAWGLTTAELRRLAPQVNTVLNLAGETNWAATQGQLHAVNVSGALAGYEVTNELQRLSGVRKTYIHISTIHVCGDQTGWIAEQPAGPDRDRTAYEHSKWIAERILVERANEPGAPALVIARVGGLLGSALTRSTMRRNSLYVLADRAGRLPLNMLPARGSSRVDMLPRDWAGAMLLDLAASAETRPPERYEIAHLCAGESAPTLAALLSALAAVDIHQRHAAIRTVALPSSLTPLLSRTLERAARLSPESRNALIALRYINFERLFERDRLAARLAEPPRQVTAEQIARLTFALPAPLPSPAPADVTFARFAG